MKFIDALSHVCDANQLAQIKKAFENAGIDIEKGPTMAGADFGDIKGIGAKVLLPLCMKAQVYIREQDAKDEHALGEAITKDGIEADLRLERHLECEQQGITCDCGCVVEETKNWDPMAVTTEQGKAINQGIKAVLGFDKQQFIEWMAQASEKELDELSDIFQKMLNVRKPGQMKMPGMAPIEPELPTGEAVHMIIVITHVPSNQTYILKANGYTAEHISHATPFSNRNEIEGRAKNWLNKQGARRKEYLVRACTARFVDGVCVATVPKTVFFKAWEKDGAVTTEFK